MEQLIFATFSIKLSYKKTNQKLSSFNEGNDLLNYIEDFFDDVLSGSIRTEEFKGKKKYHIRTEEKGYRTDTERTYYGWVSSGTSGDNYKIINLETNTKKADVGAKDGAFKDVFFYFYIPKNKETGYLILQRTGKFGAKIAIQESFQKYLRSRDLKGYSFKLFNLISGSVYEKMMANGDLKKINLIKNKIPVDLESYMKNGQEPKRMEGKLRTSIEHKERLPDSWKSLINRFFKKDRSKDERSVYYEVEDIDNQYEEIEFQLEYEGRKKTFFVINQWKTQPDIDVTAEYRERFGDQISVHKLAALARMTISDIFDIEKNING